MSGSGGSTSPPDGDQPGECPDIDAAVGVPVAPPADVRPDELIDFIILEGRCGGGGDDCPPGPCCGDPCCGDECCETICCRGDCCLNPACCDDPCCDDPCCGDPCCEDPQCCGDPWCGDPCCYDPQCCGDPCCISEDPCCENEDPYDLECGDPCLCMECDDGDPCTVDSCDPETGECDQACPIGASRLLADCPSPQPLNVTVRFIRFLDHDDISLYEQAAPGDWGHTNKTVNGDGPHWRAVNNPDHPVAYPREAIIKVRVKVKGTSSGQGQATLRVQGPDGAPGVGDNQFGVAMGDIRTIAKKIKSDHELAQKLWDTGNLEAQLLATLIIKPQSLSADEVDTMTRSTTSTKVAEWLNSYVVGQYPEKDGLREKWMKDKDRWAARAALSATQTVVCCVSFVSRVAKSLVMFKAPST